ncbi:hypothetical protein FS749_016623 [Ceratobasidium sp. UAMH 11750]|nr:hypothetical protein FS749_016623 [Ceratobasidium sp. UAMH 11750]
MYVIQDCTICLLDFDVERKPYCTPCGHVFCKQCLHAALTRSPICPTCRESCPTNAVHKIVCAHQDRPQPDSAHSSHRHERIEEPAWQEISVAIRSGSRYEQRVELVRRNPPPTAYKPGVTTPLNVAMDTMRLLVQVEKSNQMLQKRLEAAQRTEANPWKSVQGVASGRLNGEHVGPRGSSVNAWPPKSTQNATSFKPHFSANKAQQNDAFSRGNATVRGDNSRRTPTLDARRLSLQLEALKVAEVEHARGQAQAQGSTPFAGSTRRLAGRAGAGSRNRSNQDPRGQSSNPVPVFPGRIYSPWLTTMLLEDLD